MPIERRQVQHEPTIPEQPTGQIKSCSVCHAILSDPSTYLFSPERDALVCISCQNQPAASLDPREASPGPCFRSSELEESLRHPVVSDVFLDSPQEPHQPHVHFEPMIASQPQHPTKPVSITLQCNTSTSSVGTDQQRLTKREPSVEPPKSRGYTPDPWTDITRFRSRSQAHHCLYAGATFQGTQKSGRNSYDVTVTIVDVDFAASFLCGYLRIKGLTDDWPELTTYFDAEIIGSRYGFLTQNWGANEKDDMVHWARFPAFKHVKQELRHPRLTMPDRDRGAVFMRWKERFLVPDHRVQDISGASFAGFYYVCIDFNPPGSSASSITRTTSQPVPQTPKDDDESALATSPVHKTEPIPTSQRRRRDSSNRRGGRSPSTSTRPHMPTATMNGFYFHQNSEPYQQLSLTHVPSTSSSSFEFR